MHKRAGIAAGVAILALFAGAIVYRPLFGVLMTLLVGAFLIVVVLIISSVSKPQRNHKTPPGVSHMAFSLPKAPLFPKTNKSSSGSSGGGDSSSDSDSAKTSDISTPLVIMLLIVGLILIAVS